MRFVLMGATAALVAQLALAGCNKPASTAPAQTSAATTATKTSALTLGPGVFEIPKCSMDVDKPEVTYTTTIKNNFELRKPVVDQAAEYPIGNIAPKREEQTALTPSAKKKTRLDTVVTLGPGQYGKIKILIKANDMRFRDDSAVVRGGDEYSQNMFCNVNRIDDKHVEFIVYYKKGGPKLASYNLGIYVEDEDTHSGFELPIFLDPEVENNGVQ